MKIDMTGSSKRNHSVTVPRDYLENLEEFYKHHMKERNNLHGRIIKTDHPFYNVLFINENEVMDKGFNYIVIVNEEGKEIKRFEESMFTLDTKL
jgi:hypothetical protein